MKYKIEGCVLDEKTRTLVVGEEDTKIRPRTLSLLLYFINNSGRIISKEELLASVWPDVVVDEAVIFQSISEIRKLFKNKHIIINHPRKGYQLVANISSIKDTASAQKPKIKLRIGIVIAVSFITAVFIGFLKETKTVATTEAETSFAPKVLIMPVVNNTSYEEHKWLRLGGMDHVIAILEENIKGAFIYEFEDVIQILQIVNAQNTTTDVLLNKMFELSNATNIIQLEFVGKALEYKVAITFATAKSSQKTVVFAQTIDDGLNLAASEILRHFDAPLPATNVSLNNDFLHTLFAEAMLAYEKEWALAISFLESYISIEPKSVIALRYLTKLYILKDRLVEAEQMLNRIEDTGELSKEEFAYHQYYSGLLQKKRGKYNEALDWLNRIDENFDTNRPSILSARLNYSKGEILLLKQEFEKAKRQFEKALKFHEFTGNVVGINSAKIMMSVAMINQNDIENATALFNSANQQIEELNIVFLEAMASQHQHLFN